MKKGKSNLLIPVAVIVVLIAVLGVVLMKENLLDIFDSSKNALTRIEGYPKIVKSSKAAERERVVVKSKQEFDELVSKITDNPSELKFPDVNFDKENLLVVTTQKNDTTGYTIKIKSARKNEAENKLEVLIQLNKPGESCVNSEETNIAVDVVKIAKDSGEISFEKEEKTVECN